ncbi:carnitine O-acetyltransferase isoform X2 [Orussus abietinus]|uniref:carnitine O-acetyltransferase isoform X2 n=1 Tax=Orussus abietinus TaxID=222816 RepID=UPI000626663B|nr:carnitine O-acetyltransferase isoform X2 [Orussus abietinus]
MSNSNKPLITTENKRDDDSWLKLQLFKDQIMYKLLHTHPSFNKYLTRTITSINLNKVELPKQPVPDLRKTAERYLRSLKPILNPSEYRVSERITNQFINKDGPGPYLHCKLLEKYEQVDNWLSDWWLQEAYLGYRAPVIVHSSPGIVGPSQKFTCPNDMYAAAARLISAVCKFNEMVKCGEIKQEMVRNDPLDMQPYAMVLGTYRRPDKGYDQLLHIDNANHIIVICNNHFFKLNITDGSGQSTSEGKLTTLIKDIVERSCTAGKPIGLLTGNCRDTWAQDHCMLKENGYNRNILNDIECSLFVLCLDKPVPNELFRDKNSASVRALQSLTGISSSINAGNRWHDKIVQFILSSDGFIGMEYEHSPCEAGPITVLHDYVLKYISNKQSDTICNESADHEKVEELKFELNSNLEKVITKAECTVHNLTDDIDMECFTFNDFGTNAIKKALLSPDSFIQTAMQLAFYRLHKRPPVHYESAALRRFKSGRTECIRSTSSESIKFAHIMTCDGVYKQTKKEVMVAAIDAHKRFAGAATMGQGVDRHLFGMKMIAKSENMELPAFYKDVGYTRSTHFTLTSSQVAFKTPSFMCYGPVVPDGYGCCYNPRPEDIFFACSSFKSCKGTCSKSFAEALKQSLCEMKALADY